MQVISMEFPNSYFNFQCTLSDFCSFLLKYASVMVVLLTQINGFMYLHNNINRYNGFGFVLLFY